MLKLIACEFAKLKRKPLVFASVLLSILMPLAYAFFFSDEKTGADAVEGMMSSLIQLSAYLLLMPLIVILAANLLFEEQDHNTLKNLLTVPVGKARLAVAKMLVLLCFSIGFMAMGGFLSLLILFYCRAGSPLASGRCLVWRWGQALSYGQGRCPVCFW